MSCSCFRSYVKLHVLGVMSYQAPYIRNHVKLHILEIISNFIYQKLCQTSCIRSHVKLYVLQYEQYYHVITNGTLSLNTIMLMDGPKYLIV